MGRGGRGGGRYSPNDDRSRSMNPQDVCGQAAMANEARQRGDDENWDDDDYYERVPSVEIEREAPDYSHWGVYRDEPTVEKAIIKWSGVGDKFIVVYSNGIDVLKELGIPPNEGDISGEQIPVIENILISLGYEVEIERKSSEFFFY